MKYPSAIAHCQPAPKTSPIVLLNLDRTSDEAADIARRYFGLEEICVVGVETGRVNQTFKVINGQGPTYILQRLNPMFGAHEALGWNLAEISRTLTKASLKCPDLVKTLDGQTLCLEPKTGQAWRLSTFVAGRAPEPRSISEAHLSAEHLGRCHTALNLPTPINLMVLPDDGEMTNQKLTTRSDFELIAARYRHHPNLPKVMPELTRGMLCADWLPARPSFQRIFLARDLVVHRDCKRDNFLLDCDGSMAIIDWDTVGYGDPLLDLGEMCRSWAVSPTKPHFNASLAKALVEGYRATGPNLGPEHLKLIPTVIRGLALNLARRYLTDSLAETYFKWDRETYRSLHEQNLIRGGLYLDLSEELLDREIELMNI
ncbi:MAG: phosphotransferase [Deltaproteobacteria bacterium]|jgi:Ser/Thr protein kinase RdoA (MazF antagonist)|nr:phosphotransferase [Deltaproteobacteria bacterium]